jgi:RNA methyltransferase, TrmH family
LIISSSSNPRIRQLRLLEKSSERKASGMFVVEGIKEVEASLKSDYEPVAFYVCPELLHHGNYAEQFSQRSEIIEVTKQVFNSIAYRENSGGVIALFKQREHLLQHIRLTSPALVLVLESVEKPGNLGAILRTADAVKADAVIICNPQTDIYNPNVIRSGLGCFFTVQTAVADNEECLQWMLRNTIKPFIASPEAEKTLFESDLKQNVAIILGTESEGLSSFWRENTSVESFRIPMLGNADSLNVSVSCAVAAYEAVRQRMAH